jgi:ABC-2 type transport system permease protein
MSKTFAVLKREYLQAVRKKSFIILTLLMPVLFGALIFIPTLMLAKTYERKTVVVVDGTGRLEAAITGAREELLSEEGGTPNELEAAATQMQLFDARYVDAGGAADIRKAAEPYILKMRAKNVPDEEKVDAVLSVPRDAFESSEESMVYYSRASTDLIARERLGRLVNNEIQKARLVESGVPADQVDALLARVPLDGMQVTRSGEEKKGGELDFIVAFMFAGLLLIPTLVYGTEVMRSVLQEKTDRVVEILISSMKPMQLLTGKIVGLASVGLTQLLIWISIATLLAVYAGGMMATADFNILRFLRLEVFVYFFLFFLLAYLTYVCVYAIGGAVCNSEKEAQQVVMPVMMLLMVPWFLMMPIIMNPDSKMSVGLSLFPLFAPITMFVRILVSEPPLWQIALAIALSLATIYALFWVTAKVFRVGILSYGKRPTIQELVRWLRVA